MTLSFTKIVVSRSVDNFLQKFFPASPLPKVRSTWKTFNCLGKINTMTVRLMRRLLMMMLTKMKIGHAYEKAYFGVLHHSVDWKQLLNGIPGKSAVTITIILLTITIITIISIIFNLQTTTLRYSCSVSSKDATIDSFCASVKIFTKLLSERKSRGSQNICDFARIKTTTVLPFFKDKMFNIISFEDKS